jgi:cyclic beta-1,2-glucan synthetase
MVMALARLGYGDEAVELFHMMNPINRTRDAAGAQRYVVEPYVVAGDVYAHPDHSGRGGWTWYTGSAGWMYRVGIESILGLKRVGKKFAITPCIPAVWPGFKLRWQFGASTYEVEVDNAAHVSSGVSHADIDGKTVSAEAIPLVDDGRPHRVRIVMGPARPVSSESSESRSQTVR